MRVGARTNAGRRTHRCGPCDRRCSRRRSRTLSACLHVQMPRRGSCSSSGRRSVHRALLPGSRRAHSRALRGRSAALLSRCSRCRSRCRSRCGLRAAEAAPDGLRAARERRRRRRSAPAHGRLALAVASAGLGGSSLLCSGNQSLCNVSVSERVWLAASPQLSGLIFSPYRALQRSSLR